MIIVRTLDCCRNRSFSGNDFYSYPVNDNVGYKQSSDRAWTRKKETIVAQLLFRVLRKDSILALLLLKWPVSGSLGCVGCGWPYMGAAAGGWCERGIRVGSVRLLYLHRIKVMSDDQGHVVPGSFMIQYHCRGQPTEPNRRASCWHGASCVLTAKPGHDRPYVFRARQYQMSSALSLTATVGSLLLMVLATPMNTHFSALMPF